MRRQLNVDPADFGFREAKEQEKASKERIIENQSIRRKEAKRRDSGRSVEEKGRLFADSRTGDGRRR